MAKDDERLFNDFSQLGKLNKEERQSTEEELKKKWRVEEFKFVGLVGSNKNHDGQHFKNIRTEAGKQVKYPSGKLIFISIPKSIQVNENEEYTFYLKLADNKRRDLSKNKFLLVVETNKPIEKHAKREKRPRSKPKAISVVKVSDKKEVKKSSVIPSRKDVLSDILAQNNIANNLFYGRPKEVEIDGQKHFFLADIMSVEEGNLLTYQGLRKDVLVSVGDTKLELDKYVTFSLRTALLASEGTIRFSIDDKAGIKQVEKNPYQEIVRHRYERLNNPESNRMIANLMREIGKGLYSSKQRMIFELLQNADDAPEKDGTIKFHVHVSGDYFLIMHTGVPFNQGDVEAITSAAESTKRGNKKKTGYKGIGFKSVFTDSEEVVIQSGGFLFAFQRNHPSFKDFDYFYFGRERYKKYPELLVEDKKMFAKQRQEFDGARDIPWQVIPVWQKEMPNELGQSKFSQFNNNVKIAIKFGKSKIPYYLSAIDDFAETPQFILFLRNTSLFNSPENRISISKSGNNPVQITRIKAKEDPLILSYFKWEVNAVPVTNDAIAEMGVDLQKQSRVNDFGEQSFYFMTSDGTEVETIPPKLAAFETTEIAFAIPEIDGVYQAESRYLLKTEFSSFFTYLPMEERRIQLPFLVNADFVPSADREKIQGDNPWNVYLVGHIAHQHVMLLSEFANAFESDKKKYRGYLSLLLRNGIPDNNTAQEVINKYNNVYLNALSSAEFIVDDSLKVLPKDKVILDKTGLTSIFGSDLLYALTKTDKRFPHSQLDIQFLDYEYLAIEELDNNGLLESLDEEGLKLFASHVSKLNQTKLSELLPWINEVVPLCKANGVDLMDIPFVKFKSEVFSLYQILDSGDAWLASDSISDIVNVIEELGYSCIDLDLLLHNNIRQELLKYPSYVSQAGETCSRLAGHPKLSELNPTSKAALLSFLADSDFMKGVVGEKFYLGQLPLFSNQKGASSVLKELLVPSPGILASTLRDFAMDLTEYETLPNRFRGKLIAEDEVFERFFLNDTLYNSWSEQFNAINIDSHGQELLNWYKRIPEPVEISRSRWDAIPWLFINDEHRFELSEDVCCPRTFLEVTQDVYQLIHRVIGGNKVLPHYSSLALVKTFGLVCSEEPILKDISNWPLLDLSEANTFLDWVKKAKEASFFEDYSISSVDEKFQVQPSDGFLQYHSENSALISLLSSSSDSKTQLHLLPKELYDKGLERIGLLEGANLIRYLIENGFAKQAFAPFVAACDDVELSRMYLDKLDAIHLESSASYTKSTAEHQLFGILLKLASEDESLYAVLNNRVFIDDEPLNDKNVSNNVIFKFKGNDEVKDKSYQLKLSDILPAYSKESKALTNVIEAFVDLSGNILRNKVFKAVDKRKSEIRQEILAESNLYFTPQQTVFLLLWNKDGKEAFPYGERDFDDYWREKDPEKWESYCREFLSLVFKLKFHDYNYYYFVGGVDADDAILPIEYSCELDKVPKWVRDWINEEQQEKRLSFLVKAGLNDEDSEIVRLRRTIVNDEFEDFKVSCAKVGNEHLKWSTLEWLLVKQNHSGFYCGSNYIEELYGSLSKAKVPSEFVIPFYESSETELVKLVHYEKETAYHLHTDNWGIYESDVFSLISAMKGFVIPSFLPENIEKAIFVTKIELSIKLDFAKLKAGSNPLKEYEPLISNWDKISQYPIFVYEGDSIPFVVKYGTAEIPTKEKRTEVKLTDGTYYVCSAQLGKLLPSLERILPDDAYNSIYRHLNEAKENNAKQAGKAEVLYGDDELEALKRLFGDEVPVNAFKDINLAALVSGLVFLTKHGYETKTAENNLKDTHYRAQLDGVEKDGKTFTIMGRSARLGLLYLTVSSWNRLDDETTYLFVHAGNSEDDKLLFRTKAEVLQRSDTQYQVYRAEADSSVENTASILSGNFDPDKTMLILKMKQNQKYESIFSKPFTTEQGATMEDIHSGGDSDY